MATIRIKDHKTIIEQKRRDRRWHLLLGGIIGLIGFILWSLI